MHVLLNKSFGKFLFNPKEEQHFADKAKAFKQHIVFMI